MDWKLQEVELIATTPGTYWTKGILGFRMIEYKYMWLEYIIKYSSMEKLCSKMKASLELISSKITIFLKSFDFKTIHSKFKYNISYIQINDQFLIHLICYVISKQMQILDIAL